MQDFKEAKLQIFRTKILPVFLARNYTADSIVGKFDANGNLLPSEESERMAVAAKVEAFLSTAIDEAREYERSELVLRIDAPGEAVATYRDQLVKEVEAMKVRAESFAGHYRLRGGADHCRDADPENCHHHDLANGHNTALDEVLALLRPEQSDSKPGT